MWCPFNCSAMMCSLNALCAKNIATSQNLSICCHQSVQWGDLGRTALKGRGGGACLQKNKENKKGKYEMKKSNEKRKGIICFKYNLFRNQKNDCLLFLNVKFREFRAWVVGSKRKNFRFRLYNIKLYFGEKKCTFMKYQL